jgi:hypothetical protein
MRVQKERQRPTGWQKEQLMKIIQTVIRCRTRQRTENPCNTRIG